MNGVSSSRKRRAAQVQVPVLEPFLLARLEPVLDLEGRRLGAVEDLEVARVDLDLAGPELRIRIRSARRDLAANADTVLQAELTGRLVHLGEDVLLEHHLGEPLAVAQVDEDRPAVVAAVVDPAEEHDLLVEVSLGQFTARMSALELGDEAGQSGLPEGESG